MTFRATQVNDSDFARRARSVSKPHRAREARGVNYNVTGVAPALLERRQYRAPELLQFRALSSPSNNCLCRAPRRAPLGAHRVTLVLLVRLVGCLDVFIPPCPSLSCGRRLRLPTRSSIGPALPSPKPAPWSRESAGRSPVVPSAGGAPRSIYPRGSALRCRRIAARPCCSSSWMCWSQPHSPSLVW
jgi:hypothetical protein